MHFNNLSELKDRIMPALSMKEEYFKKCGYNITSDDIWNYLKNKWSSCINLTLNDMVNDILKLEYKEMK